MKKESSHNLLRLRDMNLKKMLHQNYRSCIFAIPLFLPAIYHIEYTQIKFDLMLE
jgi:hypothetical protein